MTALRRFLNRINPGVRTQTAIFIVLALLLIFLTWAMRGGQPISPLSAVRRAERASFIGPGQVIASVDLEKEAEGKGYSSTIGTYYRTVYVLRDEDLAELALITRQRIGGLLPYTETLATLFPVEMRRGLALGSVRPHIGASLEDPQYLFAFDTYPDAVRAEMELKYDLENMTFTWSAPYTGDGNPQGGSFEGDIHMTYQAQAQREVDGLFVFRFTAHNRDYKQQSFDQRAEDFLFTNLRNVFWYGEDMENKRGLHVTVTFFNASNDTIAQETALWEY